MLGRFYRGLRGFLRLPIKRKILTSLIVVLLGINRFIILFIPFKHIAGKIGKTMYETDREMDSDKFKKARLIGHYVVKLSRHTPWESKCFVQALTAKELFNVFRIPSTIYFGIKKGDDGELLAHAWIRYGEIIVTGAPQHKTFNAVAYFGS